MRTDRVRFVSALASALVLGSATTAGAHTEVTATSPASGTTAKTSIARVTITFNSQLQRGTLRVVGPGGKTVSMSNGGRDPRKLGRLLVGLKPSLRPGSYVARWTIVATDEHKQKGAFRFKLKR